MIIREEGRLKKYLLPQRESVIPTVTTKGCSGRIQIVPSLESLRGLPQDNAFPGLQRMPASGRRFLPWLSMTVCVRMTDKIMRPLQMKKKD